jgi:hypothetical protein
MGCSFLYVEVGFDMGYSSPYVEAGLGMGIPLVVEAMLAFPLDYPIQEQEQVGIHTWTQGSEVVV